MIFNLDNVLLNEVYIGETKQLIEAEKYLSKFRQRYMGNILSTIKYYKDKDLIKCTEILQDFFGFGCLSFRIVQSDIINAFTFPIDLRVDSDVLPHKTVSASSSGFKLNKQRDYAGFIFVTSGLMFNEKYTDGEVMAAVLHEIGHNFFLSLNPSMIPFNSVINVAQLLEFFHGRIDYKIFNDGMKIRQAITDYLDKNPSIITTIRDNLLFFVALMKFASSKASNVINVLTLGIATLYTSGLLVVSKILRNPASFLFMPYFYRHEKNADNFATIYGYGEELSSFLAKLESLKTNNNSRLILAMTKVPFLSALYSINTSIGYFLISFIDPHPNAITRINDQLALLKREVDKEDISPKMKKRIKQDIIACEKQIDKATSIDNDEDIADIGNRLYSKIVQDLMKGRQFKDYLFNFNQNKKFDTYDKIFKNRYNK